MNLVQVTKEQGLIGKSKPMGEAEEGGADDHRGRASGNKRISKEEATMKTKGAESKPMVAKVVVQPKELLMVEMLVVAEAVVVEAPKPKMEAMVSKATMKAAKVASHAQSSYAMRPDPHGKEHEDKEDDK